MDANKYKSVAIKVEVYNKARPMAEKDYCTMGGFISKLIEQESKKRKGRNGNKAN
jgi:macrodomain Ter protein organizer (MatP/YcbG family)